MNLLKRRMRGSIDRRRSLAGTAHLHPNVKVLKSPDGKIALKMRIERGAGFLELFRPAATERKYELDEFGAFVVRQIQKRKKVLEIIQAFERQFRMSHRESELGVVAFIKMLMKRNILSVAIEET